MKITDVELIPLSVESLNPDDCDGQYNDFVVRIHTDTGHTGIGEGDTPPHVSAALINSPSEHIWAMSMREMLIGEDPLETERIWEKLYNGCIYHTRRGLGVNIMSAIDNAVHDVAAKALGVPLYKLLGGHKRDSVVPYCSILPGTPQGRTWMELQEKTYSDLQRAVDKGYRAFKIQALFYDACTDRQLADLTHHCREIIGPDRDLMVDVGYRWRHAVDAIRAIRLMERDQLFFMETPIHTDNLDGYAKLAAAVDTPIAMGEYLSSHFEFLEYMTRDAVDVVQPDLGRAGGLTEARRIAQLARDRGLIVVPHGWKTAIAVAGLIHYSASLDNCPYIEYPDPELVTAKILRNELAGPEPELKDGCFSLPTRPGIGVEFNEECVRKYRMNVTK
ncbi:MAG: mandelate racemase/muconate lactonizing enzyme family protein [Verrucomicrobiota bacterium]